MTGKRESELDGLRAISALVVVGLHAAPTLFPGGGIGVDVFFVLSGFLITRLLVAEYAQTGTLALGRFYIRRASRLWPALLTMLAAVCAFDLAIGKGEETVLGALPAALYVMNWVRAFGGWTEGDFGHTWSLAIEEQFYLVWPLVLLLVAGARRPASWIAGLLLIAVIWRAVLASSDFSSARLYNGFDTRADGLLFGCLLAYLPDGSRLSLLAGRTWCAPALGLLAAVFLPPPLSPGAQALWLPLVAGAAAWLIVGVRVGGAGVLRAKPLVYVGTISYGVYLWHYPLALYVPFHVPGPPIVGAVAVAVASIAAAAASFRFIETPVKRLGYALSDARNARLTTHGVSA